jgi:hypothetical protein
MIRDMLNHQGYSGLSKTSIECKTCDVTESYYSSTSITRFKLEHVGHDVIEGRAPRGELTSEREGEGKVRLLKVMVELVMLPAYPSPVFTITGVKEDLKSAFVQVVSPSQRDQVRETLEKGKYLDSSSSDTVYVWEPKAISFSKDANLAMSFGPSSSVGPIPTEASPVNERPLQDDAPSTSGDAYEIQLSLSGGEQSALAIEEAAPQPEASAPLALPGPSDSPALSPPSEPVLQPEASSTASAQYNAVAAVLSPSPEPEASAKLSPESRQASAPAGPEAKEVVATRSIEGPQQAKVEEDNYLLVSRSWYIEGGSKNMGEAVRISRILRPFRWTIEPAYTIGVMVDDILSVETANGEIGGDMTKEIEGAGYKFSRVSVEKGKPVAWFKKDPASK